MLSRYCMCMHFRKYFPSSYFLPHTRLSSGYDAKIKQTVFSTRMSHTDGDIWLINAYKINALYSGWCHTKHWIFALKIFGVSLYCQKIIRLDTEISHGSLNEEKANLPEGDFREIVMPYWYALLKGNHELWHFFQSKSSFCYKTNEIDVYTEAVLFLWMISKGI